MAIALACTYNNKTSIQGGNINNPKFNSPVVVFKRLLKMADAGGGFPQPPLSYSELRVALRAGLNDQARQQWWAMLPRIPDGEGISAMENVQELATNRLKWADSKREFDKKNATIGQKIAFITRLLKNQYHLSDPDLLMPLIKYITTELHDVTIAFSALCDIVNRGEWYVAVEPSQHRVRLEAFRMLLRRNNSSLYDALINIKALEDKNLNCFFVDLFSDVFPDDHVKRLVSLHLLLLYL